jgi:hypothetical protein
MYEIKEPKQVSWPYRGFTITHSEGTTTVFNEYDQPVESFRDVDCITGEQRAVTWIDKSIAIQERTNAGGAKEIGTTYIVTNFDGTDVVFNNHDQPDQSSPCLSFITAQQRAVIWVDKSLRS